MAYGLTSTGFVEKPVETIDAEIAAAQRADPALGDDWDTSAESPSGALNGIIAAKLGEVWELGGMVYRSRDPRAATFAGLEAVCSFTGARRKDATKGTVTLRMQLAGSYTLPVGSIAHVDGQPTNRWVTTAAAVNASGSTALVDVAAEAETAGVVAANAGTITVPATPTAGWLGVTNPADAVPGTAREADPVLRARRESELGAGGTSPVDAVRAHLGRVTGVSVVSIHENSANFYAGALPPNSLEAIVQGGTDAEVASAIWQAVAGGIQTFGNTTRTVVDAGGFNRTVRFTRPTSVLGYATVTVIYDAARYAGDTAVKTAVTAVTAAQQAGQPIRQSDLIAAVRAVAGVIDCTIVLLGRTLGAQYDANLGADLAEVVKLANARVTVVRGFA